MSYTSKQAAQESQQVESGANKVVSPKFVDQRASTGVQLKQQEMMSAVQRAGLEEEPLQGKFTTVQRAEEDELLQGKFETTQLAEEEELLQGKFSTAQLMEEEEPLQGKFETAQLAEEEELLQGKFSNTATAQLEEKPNNTGLPNQLKSGIESLSGMSMDGVKVHYNSDKPTQLNAHAYAQGTDIHVAPGQEQHLPHEAWHVVQQAQGRVKPTTQMKGTSVNDDVSLESEADVMGAKALTTQLEENPVQCQSTDKGVIQKFDAGIGAGWHVHYGDHIKYSNNNATRINFAGRTRRQVGYALEQAIQAQGLAATKANADFIACKTWIRNNVA